MRLTNGTIKINKKALPVIISVLFFCFQRPLISISGVFSYVDELFAICVAAELVFLVLTGRKGLRRDELAALLIMVVLAAEGVIGNVFSGVLCSGLAIITDIISTFKVFISCYWIFLKRLTREDCDDIIKGLASCFRLIVLIMAAVYLVGLVLPAGVFSEVRYNIASYRFIFNTAGNYSKLFYLIVPLLTADLYYRDTLYKKVIIVLSLLLWISTLRTRAIAFAGCYVLFALWFFRLRGRSKKLNPISLLPFAGILLLIGWDQIVFYFTNSTQARANLLKYAIVNARTYFPIGSGFGTYGSDIAATYYSQLYYTYGFDNIYGLGKVHTNFLNDNYWPMILGQFGVIGIGLTVIILVILYRRFLAIDPERNKFFYFAAVCMAAFLLISSAASKSYSEYPMIAVFLLHAVLAEREGRGRPSGRRTHEKS